MKLSSWSKRFAPSYGVGMWLIWFCSGLRIIHARICGSPRVTQKEWQGFDLHGYSITGCLKIGPCTSPSISYPNAIFRLTYFPVHQTKRFIPGRWQIALRVFHNSINGGNFVAFARNYVGIHAATLTLPLHLCL